MNNIYVVFLEEMNPGTYDNLLTLDKSDQLILFTDINGYVSSTLVPFLKDTKAVCSFIPSDCSSPIVLSFLLGLHCEKAANQSIFIISKNKQLEELAHAAIKTEKGTLEIEVLSELMPVTKKSTKTKPNSPKNKNPETNEGELIDAEEIQSIIEQPQNGMSQKPLDCDFKYEKAPQEFHDFLKRLDIEETGLAEYDDIIYYCLIESENGDSDLLSKFDLLLQVHLGKPTYSHYFALIDVNYKKLREYIHNTSR